jgi:hypothetical protein
MYVSGVALALVGILIMGCVIGSYVNARKSMAANTPTPAQFGITTSKQHSPQGQPLCVTIGGVIFTLVFIVVGCVVLYLASSLDVHAYYDGC